MDQIKLRPGSVAALLLVAAMVVLSVVQSHAAAPTYSKEHGTDPAYVGKPVSLVSGAETMKRTDLVIGKLFPIRIERSYNSKTTYDSPLGYGWAHNYDKRLYTYSNGSVVIRKGNGWKRKFTPWSALSFSAKCDVVGGIWVPAAVYTCPAANCVLPPPLPDICKDSSGNTIFSSFDGPPPPTSGPFGTPVGETGILVKNPDGTFTYTEKDGTSELYDLQGRLVTITTPSGSSLSLTYIAPVRASLTGLLPTNIDQTTPVVVARDYRLNRIEENDASGTPSGVWVAFQYDTATGRLTTITDSIGRSVSYSHDTIGNLTGVATPALAATYGYTDPNNKHLLTTIDEGEGLYTNTYDAKGKVIKQAHGTGVIDIAYTDPYKKTTVTTTIKDSAGNILNTSTRIVEFNDQGLVGKETDTFGNETRYSYDGDFNLSRKENWENTGTLATPNLVLKTALADAYISRWYLGTRTEAQGSPVEKNTSYTYGTDNTKPLTVTTKSVVNPTQNKVTTNAYDTKGNLTAKAETGLLGGGPAYSYTTAYEYDTNSRLTRIDGPRTDVADVTTFSYAANGNLTGVTLPIIGAYTLANHDGLGNPGTVTDPNGNATTYSYDAIGRILTITAPGDTADTQYSYVGGGCPVCGGVADRLGYIILPEGNRIDYSYDTNGKLIKISDSLGNNVNYTYDSEGNRLKEEIKDPTGVLQKTISYQYDALNRLAKIINPDSTYSQYSYDSLDNSTSIKDPKGNTTSYSYDALNRRTSATQPGSITTGFGYDTNNDLANVTDGNNNATVYRTTTWAGSTRPSLPIPARQRTHMIPLET